MKKIFLDLDGTFVDLYGVDNWLEKLRNFDASPYEEAEKLQKEHNLIEKELIRLQNCGYRICILSALAKVSTKEYDVEVINAKLTWINNNFNNVNIDDIIIIPYDIPKVSYKSSDDDILIDDSESIRKEWNGIAFDEKAILENLKMIN